MLNNAFMREAIALSRKNIREGRGGPFATVVVKERNIIARGTNLVTSTNDPTAHAEIVAIREACRMLRTFQLTGCDIYTSCEPCPMCLGAIYWARPDAIYYANTHIDAANIGFDDFFIYKEIALSISERRIPMIQMMREEAFVAFEEWQKSHDKIHY